MARSSKPNQAPPSVRWCTESDRIAFTATQGLIEYRKGDVDLGRQLYFDALEAAKGPEFYRHRALALYYLVREETRANTPEARVLREQLVNELKDSTHPELVTIREKTRASMADVLTEVQRFEFPKPVTTHNTPKLPGAT